MVSTLAMNNTTQLIFLDHVPLHSKDIAPYHCTGCEQSFKRLAGYLIHTKYQRSYAQCPTPDTLVQLGLQSVNYEANGNHYDVWAVTPQRQSTTAPDEILVKLNNIAEPPNINKLGQGSFEKMALDTDNFYLFTLEEVKQRQHFNRLATASRDAKKVLRLKQLNENFWYPIPKDWRQRLQAPVTENTPKPFWWPADSSANNYKTIKNGEIL